MEDAAVTSSQRFAVPVGARFGSRRAPLIRQVSWQGRLRLGILTQVALCLIPATIALRAGDAQLAARWLFPVLLLCVVGNLMLGSSLSAVALIVAVLPMAMLLRAMFLYNSVIVLLALGVGGVLLRSPPLLSVLRRAGFTWLFPVATAYWLASYALTGQYASNLRILELVLSASALVLLAQHREQLATALCGILMSAAAIGTGLWDVGDRLGMTSVNDVRLGNPIAFGTPLALLLLLANADGGGWLLLKGRPRMRMLISGVVGMLLLLSTSRTSWLVAATGMLAVLLFNRYHRGWAVASLGLLVIAATIVLQTNRGTFLTVWYNRTFAPGRTLAQRTSGRSDQWSMFSEVMKDVPLWGFGPGSGRDVHARYSALKPRAKLRAGSRLEWHSLYQQLAVETGVIGTAALLLLLIHMVKGNYRWWHGDGVITPLLGTIGFMLIAATVSVMDGASGLFLGFALLPPPRARVSD